MAELSVTRKNISKLFSDEMQGKKYVIPDYQRPYKWDKEKCETLWGDIATFYEESKGLEEYFLGTIVTTKESESENKNKIEVIDGQQRITSLFLLLRAFYTRLEGMPKDDLDVIGLKGQIAPCIWDVNPISKTVENSAEIHIESCVATAVDVDNDFFHKILKDGEFPEQDKGKKSLYASNYLFFHEKSGEYAKTNPMQWKEFVVYILKKCIVLPIECENQDMALTIFNTLNDRGLQLSDSDIFKAKIYKIKKDDEKKAFTKDWKDLTETTENAEISLDDLFRYYTHVIRGEAGDKSKEIGLRKFYNDARLRKADLIGDLSELADFWFSVNTGKSTIGDDKVEKINAEAKKYLQCLQYYPNEFWKYVTSVFFYKNKGDPCFVDTFPDFLKKLSAFLFAKFIVKPTVNAIKDDIYQLGINISVPCSCYSVTGLPHQPPEDVICFDFKIIEDEFKKQISETCTGRIAKGLILLHAYQNSEQKEVIDNFEIEHIFPRKWQNKNYNGWREEDAEDYLEKYGNKVAIEKRINIQAGNGYFGKKKDKYANSKIAEVVALSKHSKDDWVKADIENREGIFIDVLCKFFKNNLPPQEQR